MSGFFFFQRNVLKRVHLTQKGYKILLEMLVKCKPKAIEVPYVFRDREFGASKIGFKVYFDYLAHLAKLYAYKFGR